MSDSSSTDDDVKGGGRAEVALWKRAGALLYVLASNALLILFVATAITEEGFGSPLAWSLSEWAAAAVWLGPTVAVGLLFTVLLPFMWWKGARRRRARKSELEATRDLGELSREGVVFEYETDDAAETADSEVEEGEEVEIESG